MSIELIPQILTLLLQITSIYNMTPKSCNIDHVHYDLICTRFEFWCTSKPDLLTYEAICENITLTAKSDLMLEGAEKITDIEIHTSDVVSLTAEMFIDFPNLTRLYLETGNTREIQANAFKGLNKLDWLILRKNNISIIQPQAFRGLEQLNLLNLNFNELTELKDDTFKGLDSIQYITLKNNKIGSIEDDTFASLKKLGTIFLNNNLLTVISDSLFANNYLLRFARFPNNKIGAFPENFFQNKTYLREVILDNNQIISVNYRGFNGNISLNNNKLQKLLPFGQLSKDFLDLSFNNVSSVPASIFGASSSSLRKLLLNNNDIYIIDKAAFRNLTKLRTLRLDNNKISELPLGIFQDLKILELLDMSHNRIQHLESGIFTGLRYLSTLDLSHNKIYIMQISSLYPLKLLKILYLDNNLLEYLNIDDMISHLVNLESISIDNNSWSCDWLSSNLIKFDAHRIKILHGTVFDTSNVHGIPCNNSEFDMKRYNPLPEKKDNNAQEKLFKNSIQASNSGYTSSGSGAAVYILITLGVVLILGIALYVLNRYWLRRRIASRGSQSSEIVSYKLDLDDDDEL